MAAMQIVSDEVRQFIVRLYRQGAHTQAMIAEIAGTTQSNVSKVLAKCRRNGIVLPRRNRVTRERKLLTISASQIVSGGRSLNLDYL